MNSIVTFLKVENQTKYTISYTIPSSIKAKKDEEGKRTRSRNVDTHTRVNEFNTTKQSGNVGIFFSHAGFVGPYTMVQPSHQIHIIGYAPRKLLRSVDMRINKPCVLKANQDLRQQC